jgi:hypothetical protein
MPTNVITDVVFKRRSYFVCFYAALCSETTATRERAGRKLGFLRDKIQISVFRGPVFCRSFSYEHQQGNHEYYHHQQEAGCRVQEDTVWRDQPKLPSHCVWGSAISMLWVGACQDTWIQYRLDGNQASTSMLWFCACQDTCIQDRFEGNQASTSWWRALVFFWTNGTLAAEIGSRFLSAVIWSRLPEAWTCLRVFWGCCA